jgi:hypothetical protein
MNLKLTILSLLALLVLLVALPLMVYDSESRELTIETISRQSNYTGNQNTSPSIQVISSRPYSPVKDVLPQDAAAIDSVDFSRYFVMVVSFGYGSAVQNTVQDIFQFKSVFWIKSNITSDKDHPTKFSPYQIIKIDKSEMVRYGKITFRLLNQFEEKAKTIQVVLPVGEPVQPALVSASY